MTRCIHCTRCVRFGQEIAGIQELGTIGRGERMQISTFIERSVDHELSGNIIDLCPVGALNSKPYRFSARAWEMQALPTVAPHDCVGSNLSAHVLLGKVKRVVPRANEAVNETWLADRDRFSYEGIYADRLEQPMLRDGGGPAPRELGAGAGGRCAAGIAAAVEQGGNGLGAWAAPDLDGGGGLPPAAAAAAPGLRQSRPPAAAPGLPAAGPGSGVPLAGHVPGRARAGRCHPRRRLESAPRGAADRAPGAQGRPARRPRGVRQSRRATSICTRSPATSRRDWIWSAACAVCWPTARMPRPLRSWPGCAAPRGPVMLLGQIAGRHPRLADLRQAAGELSRQYSAPDRLSVGRRKLGRPGAGRRAAPPRGRLACPWPGRAGTWPRCWPSRWPDWCC